MSVDQPSSKLIREEAWEHARITDQQAGEVLRLSPTWISWTYWLLLLLVWAGFLYTVFGTVTEYAEGPALIWMEGRPITAQSAGTVASLLVEPGHRVPAGRQVLGFYSSGRSGEEAWIRAPIAGLVREVHVRVGQHFAPGDVLLTLYEPSRERKTTVIALLPAHHRPFLQEGMEMRLELTGYRHAFQTADIKRVSSAALGADMVRQYLGRDLADTVQVQGPVVWVRACLDSTSFEVDGQALELFHGMQGTAAVAVRREPILLALIPWLRTLISN